MNYRHIFHAGNFADVMKHALLVPLIRAMQRKDKGFLYLDTHAGVGGYDLSRAEEGDTLKRQPEYPNGIGRLWSHIPVAEPLKAYLSLVKSYNQRQGATGAALRFYPGSPWIARLLAREQDRLALVDLHPDDGVALEGEFVFERGVKVHRMDGYTALKAMLPPPEKRALVLIDPPFEAQNEFDQIIRGISEALKRFPSGVYAIWYPLTSRARVDDFRYALMGLPLPPTLMMELSIAGEQSAIKMRGCGLVVINPPWQYDREADAILSELGEVLTQEPGAGSRLDWLVKEN
ncbi:MAG TPA: 23S rRNA (adenine(2030)-N(6))-methyltransferase RlmJ [Opitutaceae bacterium]|nr:23S rRNA (adenine(2030)-N(6))-methyltransferase RlmJ [Opitutaceae bacterium]